MPRDPIPHPVKYDLTGHVARLTLDRPDRLNAITPGLFDGIEAGLSRATDDNARVVIMEGEGRAFCVGADMKNHAELDRSLAEKQAYVWSNQEACKRIQTYERPVIAKVHGYAIGGGADIALSTDLIAASQDAQFRFPETSLGSYITGGSTYTLPQRVGVGTAKDLLMTGRWVDGDEAEEIGLVDRLAASDDLDEAVDEWATAIAANAPIPIALVKEHLNSHHADRSLWLSREVEGLLTCMGTDDWQEGVDAFADDREPEYTGH